MRHTEAILPFIYTPTVGEACERYHELPLTPHGLYVRCGIMISSVSSLSPLSLSTIPFCLVYFLTRSSRLSHSLEDRGGVAAKLKRMLPRGGADARVMVRRASSLIPLLPSQQTSPP